MHKVLFTASLSNGENIYEEKGNFQTTPGALSPWQRFLAYLGETKLKITSLSLYTPDGRRWNLPSAGKNPKFREFAVIEQPVGYRMFRKMGGDAINTGEIINPDLYTVIEAQYAGGKKIQVWVDEKTLNSWSLIL